MTTPPPDDAPRLRELVFHYQPIFDPCGNAVSYEALVRWPQPDGTIRGPGDFLTALLDPESVDGFTRHTITGLATALAARPEVPCVHLNLSPRQLTLPATHRILTGLRPTVRDRLVVELTEQRIPDPHAYGASVRLLAASGLEVVLDDVVPGDLPRRLASDLPIAGVKVDRSVVRELLWAPWSTQARSVRGLAERGVRLTAEGIEDPAVVGELRELGFTRFQGFGLGTPRASLAEAVRGHPPSVAASDAP